MDTQPLPLPEPTSLRLQSAPDLPAHLGLLAGPNDDLPGLRQTLIGGVVDLDDHLTDLAATLTGFVEAVGQDAHAAADRVALLRLCELVGVPLPSLAACASGPRPPRKRSLTNLETLLVRICAHDASPRAAVALAVAEAGASHREAADLRHQDLRLDGDCWVVDVPGDRDSTPRVLTLPAWAGADAARLARSDTGPWLLYRTGCSAPDRRSSVLQLLMGRTLDAATLNWPRTVTGASIRRSALRRLAASGPDGWDAAVAAAGHRNPDVTDRLLRLHQPW